MSTQNFFAPPPLKGQPSSLNSLESLFQDAERVTHAKEDLIVMDGVESDDMFRVVRGIVRVEKGDARTPVGQGAVVNQLRAGQTFGEMSFLDKTMPCANCIADTDDVELEKVSKVTLAARLEADHDLARDFYKHMAIAVTQRLSLVSSASAEIPEAPRGAAQPLDEKASKELSAAKLLKVRRRLNIPDAVSMACMMKTSMVSGKNRKHGVLYVFETTIGFVTKAFGIKTHEAFSFNQISEVLRETFTLKRDDNAIEIHLTSPSNRVIVFYPAHVDSAYEAIHRCRAQYENVFKNAELSPSSGVTSTKDGNDTTRGRTGRRGSGLAAPELAFSMNPHAGQLTARTQESRAAEARAAGAISALLDTASLERYKAADVIIENGSRHCTLFNLVKGKVAVEVQRLNEDTQLMQSVKILTLYEGAIFGEMSFLNGDVACASVVAEVPCELYEIKASQIENMLSEGEKATAAAFYRHLGTYLTHRVRQLTYVVGEALASRVTDIPIEEVLSNGIFFSQFKRFMTEKRLVPGKLLAFLSELNEFLDMPGNLEQLWFARGLLSKYLDGDEPAFAVPADKHAAVAKALASEVVPPRDLFRDVLSVVLSQLQVNAYRLFTQSSSFQPLLDLKAREQQVPLVTDFKLLQILGEGYEGKVLQARKKDCGVFYALKVLDKTILASRSRRWQLHCSRELECLIACNHPYVVALAYSFQTPQYLYMVQEYLPNHTLAQYLDAHQGRPVDVEQIRFCVAELACGLAHIHSHKIVYRDLKPANVLVDDAGHMRIVDMGMASRLDPETGRRKSVCGTQRYMAPEMKAKEPYTTSVDWYSLGKLILDCQGRSAYQETTARQWAESALDSLVDGLLIKDPTRRLACRSSGFRDLQDHAFFTKARLDWAVVDMRKMPSPLHRPWYEREPDIAMARQFRNGEDIAVVVNKLQSLALGSSSETGPGMVPKWDHVNPLAVYSEYVSSPYLNYKLPLQF